MILLVIYKNMIDYNAKEDEQLVENIIEPKNIKVKIDLFQKDIFQIMMEKK